MGIAEFRSVLMRAGLLLGMAGCCVGILRFGGPSALTSTLSCASGIVSRPPAPGPSNHAVETDTPTGLPHSPVAVLSYFRTRRQAPEFDTSFQTEPPTPTATELALQHDEAGLTNDPWIDEARKSLSTPPREGTTDESIGSAVIRFEHIPSPIATPVDPAPRLNAAAVKDALSENASSGSVRELPVQAASVPVLPATGSIAAPPPGDPSSADLELTVWVENLAGPPFDLFPFANDESTVRVHVSLSNGGPASATQVHVRADVAKAVVSDAASVTVTGGHVIEDTWQIDTLPAGSSETLSFMATIRSSLFFPPCDTAGFHAEILGAMPSDPDSTPGNGNPDEDDQDEIELPVLLREFDTISDVSAWVFFDDNGNGVMDPGEAGADGVRAYLEVAPPACASGEDDGHAAYPPPVAAEGVSGEGGQVVFERVPWGYFRVRIDSSTLPDGTFLGPLTPNPSPAFVSSEEEVSFGLLSSSLIDGFAFFDINGNGSADEPLRNAGLNGVRVQLFTAMDPPVFVEEQVTRTREDGDRGYYAFTGLVQGTYLVRLDASTLPAVFDVNSSPLEFVVSSPVIPDGAGALPDFGFVFAPTAIKLASFEVLNDGFGITLRWSTAMEIENLGFNVYRASSASGTRTQVNNSLILATGRGEGRDYVIEDPLATPASRWFYWLEDLDWSFRSTLHGPYTF